MKRAGVVAVLLLALTACGTADADEVQQPPEPTASTPMNDWCYASSWLKAASGSYYYLYRDNPHSLAKIRGESDYGGMLMGSWQHKMDQGELPNGIEPDLQAWAVQLTVMQQEGLGIGEYTEGVLAHCRK